VISLGDDDFIFSAQKIFVTYLRNTMEDKRRFNRKGVVMNIHRERLLDIFALSVPDDGYSLSVPDE
jgi:hypothetical protein